MKKKVKKNIPNKKDDEQLFAFLATFLSIIGFVIALILKRDNKYVMFYAKQSLIVFIAGAVLGVAAAIFNFVPVMGVIIKVAANLIGFILWLTDTNPNLKVKLAFFDNNVLQNAKIELEKTLKNRNSNIDLLMYNAFFKIPFTENDLTILSINTWKDFNANKNAENIIPTSILILKPKIKHAN